MLNFSKIIAVFILAVLLLIAIFSFAFKIANISLPKDYTEMNIPFIDGEINVFKNDYGIQHIFAKSEKDSYFMLGYIHAQDRLWQMDYSRRLASGRLAEIFGKEALVYDKFIRLVDLKTVSNIILKQLDGNTKLILESYCKGINEFVNQNRNRLPFEFGTLNYIPDEFEPIDCILIHRLHCFKMNEGFWTDLAFGEIAESIGVRKALKLIPSYPIEGPYIYEAPPKIIPKIDTLNLFDSLFSRDISQNKVITEFYKTKIEIADFYNINNSIKGSNAWAIRKSEERNSPAVFAVDPHSEIELPSKWYPISVSCPSFNITGLTMPGIPFFYFGRNDFISWGYSSMMADESDFFMERINENDSIPSYLNNNTYKPLNYILDTIIVLNDEPHIYHIRTTDKSALLSDLHIVQNSNCPAFANENLQQYQSILEKFALSFRWTGKTPSNEFNALYHINKAKNWEQFIYGVNLWKVPAVNFVFADSKGNIGVTAAGIIPNRQTLCQPSLPNPTWLDTYNWSGTQNINPIARKFNPPDRFVFAANNKLFHTSNQFITNYWEPNSRAKRIDSLLKESYKYNYRDAQIMQNDVVSPYSEYFLKLTLPILQSRYREFDLVEKQAIELLKSWDYLHSSKNQAATIFNQFLMKLKFNVFSLDLNNELLEKYFSLTNISARRIIELLEEHSSHWLNSEFKIYSKTKEDVVFDSFNQAIYDLRVFYKSDSINTWEWGKKHKVDFKHILCNKSMLNPILRKGEFELAGNHTTINLTEYDFNNLFNTKSAAAFRFIADMSEDVVYISIPGGNSGDPMSINYADQLQLWLNGGYIKINRGVAAKENLQLTIKAKN